MRLSLAVSLLAVFTGHMTEAKGGRGKKVAAQGGNSGQPNLADFERGRRRKRKKVPPVKRFNFLVQKLDEFRRNNVVDNHKKTANKMSRFKNMLVNNLGVLKTPRTIRCMKIEESDKFIRQQKQAARKEALNEERMQRKAKVAERRERRLQEKNLFDNDVVERRKREDSSNDLSTEGEDFDYSYYYYGEGDDYEVYVGDYDNEFDQIYPDYEDYDTPGNGIQARGRRKKKKGRKPGPIKQFFNLNASIRKFIEDELKSCARKDVYVKRLGRLADNIKINAPVLTKPPKRKGKKGKKGKQRG